MFLNGELLETDTGLPSRFRLDELVEPMVWTYVKDVYRFIPYSNWVTFGETFPYIWAASASKGE